MVPLKFLRLLNPFAVRGLVSPLALFWELNLTTGCVAADTSVLGSICERAPLVWAAVWTCSPFEVSREGLVVLLCGAGPTGPCLCGGC